MGAENSSPKIKIWLVEIFWISLSDIHAFFMPFGILKIVMDIGQCNIFGYIHTIQSLYSQWPCQWPYQWVNQWDQVSGEVSVILQKNVCSYIAIQVANLFGFSQQGYAQIIHIQQCNCLLLYYVHKTQVNELCSYS